MSPIANPERSTRPSAATTPLAPAARAGTGPNAPAGATPGRATDLSAPGAAVKTPSAPGARAPAGPRAETEGGSTTGRSPAGSPWFARAEPGNGRSAGTDAFIARATCGTWACPEAAPPAGTRKAIASTGATRIPTTREKGMARPGIPTINSPVDPLSRGMSRPRHHRSEPIGHSARLSMPLP